MPNEYYIDDITATDMKNALDELLPDTNDGVVPVLDQFDALDAYRAFDDDALAEVPQALAAYVDHQQHFDI